MTRIYFLNILDIVNNIKRITSHSVPLGMSTIIVKNDKKVFVPTNNLNGISKLGLEASLTPDYFKLGLTLITSERFSEKKLDQAYELAKKHFAQFVPEWNISLWAVNDSSNSYYNRQQNLQQIMININSSNGEDALQDNFYTRNLYNSKPIWAAISRSNGFEKEKVHSFDPYIKFGQIVSKVRDFTSFIEGYSNGLNSDDFIHPHIMHDETLTLPDNFTFTKNYGIGFVAFTNNKLSEQWITLSSLDEIINPNTKSFGGVIEDESVGADNLSHKRLKKTKKSIIENLDAYVIGQSEAKNILASATYKHLSRGLQSNEGAIIENTNVLLLGPSGSGKTYLVETLQNSLGVPLVIQDATSLTQEGYVGESVDVMITKLVEHANGSVELAEKGIIFIDEIDKLSSYQNSGTISTIGVQESLLTLLQGKKVQTKYGVVDTSNILFISGGAFEGDANTGRKSLQEIITGRLGQKESNRIGFGVQMMAKKEASQNYDVISNTVQPEDIKAYGIIPQLIGRFPSRASLSPLGADEIRRIATEPKNSYVKQVQKLLKQDGINVIFTEEAIDYIVKRSMNAPTGVRELKTYFAKIENKLLDQVGETDKVEITLDLAKQYINNVD